MALLSDGLRMRMLLRSVVIVLLLMVTLLLVHPRGILWVLMLMGEDMMGVDHDGQPSLKARLYRNN